MFTRMISTAVEYTQNRGKVSPTNLQSAKAVTPTHSKRVSIEEIIPKSFLKTKSCRAMTRSSPRLFDAISFIQMVPNAICVVDTAGLILGCNKGFEKQFPIECNEDNIGRNILQNIFSVDKNKFIKILKSIQYDDKDIIEDDFVSGNSIGWAQCTWSFGSGLDQGYIVLTCLQTVSNASIEENSRNEILRSFCSGNSSVIEICHSITSGEKTEIKVLNDKLSNLSRKLDMKQVFVRHTSHEIRTPLSVLASGFELLKGNLDNIDEETKELIVDMESACEVAIDNVNDLLTYEKIDSDLLTLEIEECDLKEIVQRTYEMFRTPAREKRVSFFVEDSVRYRPIYVNVDKHKITQVLRNLVSNAVKFTSSGGSVVVRVGLRGNHSRIEVHDTGAGMTKEERAKLFKNVVQFNAKDLQKGGGSGFGLFLSYNIVVKHGGIIGVDQEWEGKGSIFFLELPVEK